MQRGTGDSAAQRPLRVLAICAALVVRQSTAWSAQFDIAGPPGSGAFGARVAVLPNGNFVVTDPYFSTPNARRVGVVYLYGPDAILISTLTGSSENDHVGGGQIAVLANGNFVVSTPDWNNGDAAFAGAVTWINGTKGLAGVVSPENSLVGTTANDQVGGYIGLLALTNGNYVVASPGWSNAGAKNAGAVTWGDGNSGIAGAVSADNSLVGTDAQDLVGEDQSRTGAVVALPNGNYVVSSSFWHFATQTNYGAVTWGDGRGGTVGPVSRHNSLLETTDCPSDVGRPNQISVLANGNYVVASACWSLGSAINVGALTWEDGSQATTGTVSPGNSLVGDSNDDRLGIYGVTVLSNGNYVVLSPFWGGGIGAATWVDGNSRMAGRVSARNSIVGSVPGDYAGVSATPLNNGNFVVRSWWWNSADAQGVGAVTWAEGNNGTTVGPISEENSLVGSTALDHVGSGGVISLRNGNYVVASPRWSSAAVPQAGAVTWMDGSRPTSGHVTAAESIVGTTANEQVGAGGVTAVGDGNYVIVSPSWSNGSLGNAGAVTWQAGTHSSSGVISAANSVVGSNANDAIGSGGVTVLANGNFVVESSAWYGGGGVLGAVTWMSGERASIGSLSARNSLVGTSANQYAGSIVEALSGGNYFVYDPHWQNGDVYEAGAIALANGRFGLTGTFAAWNSVFGDRYYYGSGFTTAYDASRQRLVVGRPYENVVSLLAMDQIFAASFE